MTPELNRHQIFTHPLDERRVLVYAPLSGMLTFATPEEVMAAEVNGADDEFVSQADTEAETPLMMPDISGYDEMTILLNQRCNFHCAYCYSAGGRDNSQIDRDTLLATVRGFILERPGKSLTLTFSGGGDPVLSFPLFTDAVICAESVAEQCGSSLEIGMVTNGSTLTDRHIEFIRQHNVSIVVSFDVIKEVHDEQRSNYDEVAVTIRKLLACKVIPGIRSTITPLNVTRMPEMVDALHKDFPELTAIAMEPVLNPGLFATVKDLDAFYGRFAEGIHAARKEGAHFGITVGNTILNNIDSCKNRACMGKFVLTPSGRIVGCSRISSPAEPLFEDFSYGFASKNGLRIDLNRYGKIFGNTVETMEECRGCLAKWHCSGGCFLARKTLSTEYMASFCRFMRQMVVSELLDKTEYDD